NEREECRSFDFSEYAAAQAVQESHAPSPVPNLFGEDRSLCSWTLLRFRRAEALSGCVFLAHVGAVLGVAVILITGEVINLRSEIGPDYDIGGTVRFRLTLCRKLVTT